MPDFPPLCPECYSSRYDTTPGYDGRVYECGSGWFEGDTEFVQHAACPIIASLRKRDSELWTEAQVKIDRCKATASEQRREIAKLEQEIRRLEVEVDHLQVRIWELEEPK